MTLGKAPLVTLLLMASLIGGRRHPLFDLFLFVLLIARGVRTALAFVAACLWRRAGLGSSILALIYPAIECGPIMMALRAWVNYSETGQTGFGLSCWMIPAAADFVMLWMGAHWPARRRSEA